jgi:AraC family transcriptional activator of pobA
MFQQHFSTLINPQTGNLAFKILPFEDNSYFDHLQRLNYYSIIWVKKGNGTLKADFNEYAFSEGTMMSFSPYQPFMIEATGNINGVAIHFHPDFFCIHKHHKEVACHGVLFNNIYQPPFVKVEGIEVEALDQLIEQMVAEMKQAALAQYELLVSLLKIFLIRASRLKASQQPQEQTATTGQEEPFVIQNLKTAIEAHYKTKHSAGDYADMLNISAKALAKVSKAHFNKTLTQLISERIIIEAKRELYLTSKPIKAIAGELGFDDEYYFSRFFKTNADVSPQLYRNTVGFARAEQPSAN